MIRVMLADDHHLVREGIRSLLDKAIDMEVVGEAEDGQDALDQITTLRPDVLVLDVAMPRLNGIQVVEQVRNLNLPTRIIMLSMYDDDTLVRRALRQGASGYLLKRSITEELLLAIRAAHRNESYLSPGVSAGVLQDVINPRNRGDNVDMYDRLSPRERQVLQLLSEGHTNASIAEHLVLSVKTVEKHRANLMLKLGVSDLASLIRVSIKHGLILLEENPTNPRPNPPLE